MLLSGLINKWYLNECKIHVKMNIQKKKVRHIYIRMSLACDIWERKKKEKDAKKRMGNDDDDDDPSLMLVDFSISAAASPPMMGRTEQRTMAHRSIIFSSGRIAESPTTIIAF